MRKNTLAICLSIVAGHQASALNIALDYSDDSSGFFNNAIARATVEKAAQDLGAVITTTLAPITTSTFSGTNGTTSAQFEWYLNYTNPSTGGTVTLNNFTSAADTYTIYVGARPLTGGTLGAGGIGAGGFQISGSGQSSQWVGAVNAAANASNAALQRGTSVTFDSLSDSATLGSATANYTVSYGPIVGNLWFNNDGNGDGNIDDAAMLGNYWNLDSAITSFSGKNDLYSVALHEMIHSLGFGGSVSWDNAHSGTTWLGANGVAANGGTGVGLLEADQVHIVSNYLSRRVDNGAVQEAVMDPSLTVGTRKYLTAIDLATLSDLGYEVVPEVNTLGLLLLGTVGLIGWRRCRRLERVA